jgi:NADPH:quinone reductase-like Zn-dependent oxidoreductase
MRAIVRHEYGRPDVLELREIEKPAVAEDGVLVRVQAASVNPVDWHTLIGEPYLVRASAGLRKPKSQALGVDFAGTVEAVGKSVTEFRPGDEVFGARHGAFAEYLSVRADRAVVRKPPNVTFEHAASVPIAAITALQALRDKGQVRAGQNVLINGASGGVGTFAVQIAKSLGAEVTGVCRTHNVDMVRSLGADDVIDYTQEDFTRNGKRYDLMIDVAGNRSWSECKRVLKENATVVIVGGPKTNRWVGPMAQGIARRLASIPGSRKVVSPFLAVIKKPDLIVLQRLLDSGEVTPALERSYELSETADALRYVGTGHAKAKLVIRV